MEKPTIYLETSFFSYLTAIPSRDLLNAARQRTSHEWWELKRRHYDLFVSQLVYDEAEQGDSGAARSRIAIISSIASLAFTPLALSVARLLIDRKVLPKKAQIDALHIGVAAASGMDSIRTWNFKHIANAQIRRHIENICYGQGIECPIIATPDELLGGRRG